MTAATIRTIPMVFILNAQSSDFTATLATGIITYTGTPTKLFRVSIVVGYTFPGNNNTLQYGITKNSTLSFTNSSSVQRGAAVSGNIVSVNVNDIFSLATNDTITIIGEVSTTATVTYQFCNIVITQV
jgi:hypothetical protein